MEKRGDVGNHTPSDRPCCGGQCKTASKETPREQARKVAHDLLDQTAAPKKS